MSEEDYENVAGYRQRDEYSARERLAIEYAERFALYHHDMDAEFFDRMRAEFKDEEIVELAGTVAFCLAIGRVSTVLDIANECPVVHQV